MWSFTYQGTGSKGSEAERIAAQGAQIAELAEKQMVDKPEGAIPHIRAAAAAVAALAQASDGKVQIVAEGWVERDGQASTTINVMCFPVAAPTT